MSASSSLDLERLRAVQRAVQRLATLPEAPPDLSGAFAEWGVHADDAAELSRFSRDRTGVYGGLVGSTVLTAFSKQLPLTAARLPAGALRRMVERFLAEQAPRSAYLRDAAFELAIFASGRWPGEAAAPHYTADLTRYELLLFAVGAAERGPRPAAPEPLAADRGVWLDGTVHLGRFGHAVHALPDDPADTAAPEPHDANVLVYRDADNETQVMELTLPAMAILERLAAGAPLGRAITEAAAELGHSVDAAWIEALSSLLADLSGRGLLFGAAPPGEAPRLEATSSPYRDWLLKGG